MDRDIQFDPELKQLLLRTTGDPLGEAGPPEAEPVLIPVIARLYDPAVPIEGFSPVTRIGAIVTGRVPVDDVVRLRGDANIASLKAGVPIGPALEMETLNVAEAAFVVQEAPPPEATGRGVVVGVVDWGCDFAHANFRDAEGGSRLLALWDQRGGRQAESPQPFGYGREFDRARINAALAAPDPYAELRYDPASLDPTGVGTHGTHVLDIAAGSGFAPGATPGVAPGADLIFVHLKGDDTPPEETLGDSVRVLEAVRYVADRAADRPAVINLSLGRTGGPHDATPLVVQGLDALVEERPGLVICMSAGNYFLANLHVADRLETGESKELCWSVTPTNDEFAELEIWYPSPDALTVEVINPTGRSLARAPLGEDRVVRQDDTVLISLFHRRSDPNNGDNQVDLFIWPSAPPGVWTVRLHGDAVSDGRFHAWIERDNPAFQSRFSPAAATQTHTTGSICNGLKTIAVGAYDAREPACPILPFSSMGPTRDGRHLPHVSAPGAGIRAARSSSLTAQGRVMDGLTVKSGTSMAAPHVAGVCALVMEAAGDRRLTAEAVRRILMETAATAPPSDETERLRYGAGRVDAAAAVRAARKSDAAEEVEAMEATESVLDAVAPAGEAAPVETDGVEVEREAAFAAESEALLAADAEATADIAATDDVAADDVGEAIVAEVMAGEAVVARDEPDEAFASPYEPPISDAAMPETFAPWEDESALPEPDEAMLTPEAELEPAPERAWRLVDVGDQELRQRDERGVPIYDRTQLLRFGPTGRRYAVTDGRYHYHAANFVYNTAYDVGYDVPVYPASSPNAADGRSYENSATTFDALAADDEAGRYFRRFFTVVAAPGEAAPDTLRAGDVLLHGPEPEEPFGHLAVIADPVLRAMDDPLFQDRDRARGTGVQCIEAGLTIRARDDRFGRALTDDEGRVLPTRMVVRFRAETTEPGLERANGRNGRRAERGVGETLVDAYPGEPDGLGLPTETATFADVEFLPLAGVFVPVPITTDDHSGFNPGATPPFTMTTTTFRDIATLNGLPAPPIRLAPGRFAVFSLGDAFLATGICRRDPGDARLFELALGGTVCYPADPADRTKLAPGGPFPVTAILHGQHESFDFAVTPSGPPVTVAPGQQIVPSTVTGISSNVANHDGYRYLQEDLARNGIVSISVGTNAANFVDSLLKMRADLLLAGLDHLRHLNNDAGSRFFHRLAFSRVGLVGHSRGGEAVVLAAALNARRPSAARHGIDCVVSLAPTDFTGMLRPAERLRAGAVDYLVVYGSHDGDVSGSDGPDGVGGTGFRHYDRADHRRAMIFIHGANHNRFNTNWGLHDNPFSPDGDPRILSDADHRALAQEYIGGWLRLVLLGDPSLAPLFDGTQRNRLGRTVATQWKLGRRLQTIDDFDDAVPGRNRLGGRATAPGFVSEVSLPAEGFQFPHQDRVLRARVAAGSVGAYRSELPAGQRDLTGFTHLTLRLTKRFDVSSSGAVSGAALPRFSIQLVDGGGSRASADQTAVYAASAPTAPNRPYFRILDGVNVTKNQLETLKIPLASFAGINRRDVRAIELHFDPAQPDDIYFDTISLIRR